MLLTPMCSVPSPGSVGCQLTRSMCPTPIAILQRLTRQRERLEDEVSTMPSRSRGVPIRIVPSPVRTDLAVLPLRWLVTSSCLSAPAS